ncbi:MAG: hypothetical protein OIF36_02180 [Alphaproteobacteria bacterium]|jgi:hypothetical protein|nr:hypothetical protein [Alphaproteobacteria bacterium]MCV6599275.1 hypothetical protein [Alphaproteobacteria bacterium]
MKKVFLLILLGLVVLSSNSFARVRVNGYYRSNGTYVAPHYRSNPDGIKSNNYSYRGY